MISNKPYLLRAFYQWIVDSACTPILVINAKHPHCKVPHDYVEGGEIVFNISAAAVRDLNISNELIQFKASFSGVIHLIAAPVNAILAIYAEENGEGIFFDAEEGDTENATDHRTAPDELIALKDIDETDSIEPVMHHKRPLKSKPFLKLVE